jgi:hypothetical protein
MPKKTKKEKIIAEARRVISQSRLEKTIAPSREQTPVKESTSHPASFTYSKTPPQQSTKTQMYDLASNEEFTAIRHDLIKIIVLALIATGVVVLCAIKFGIGS